MSTTVTNETSGAINTTRILHQDYFNYPWLIVAILTPAVLAWTLRKLIWRVDSN